MNRPATFLVALAVLFGSASSARADYFTIGPDAVGVPRAFTSLSPSGTATFAFNLDDGSLGFDGGLTFRPDDSQFYAIANDFTGASSFVSFAGNGAGAFTTVAALGNGFLGGLTYNPTDGFFYAIRSDFVGASSLQRIDPSGVATHVADIGIGFLGGLTFNPLDGLLYAISGDGFGVQRNVSAITSAGTVTPLFALGDGSQAFNGGLAVDATSGTFYIISNDFLGVSTLNTFSLGGGAASLTPVDAFGQGFINRGLVSVIVAAPEPAVLPLALMGLLAFSVVRKFL